LGVFLSLRKKTKMVISTKKGITLTIKDFAYIIGFAVSVGIFWMTTDGRITSNTTAVNRIEKNVEQIKKKTDETHDAVIRISTIIEHR